MPKQISPEQKIIRIERENVMLRQRNLNLKQKMAAMKVEYEKKLEARKEVICDEERRQQLIAQRERVLAEEHARARKGDFKE
jgi:hypothetical protein